MKDTRFTELVNLYIDRQMTPTEAAEFEQEIQTNPQRRQIYRQYCQMHRATKLVYESFRAHADETERPATPPATTIAHLHNRQTARRNRWLYAAGGLAAAACLVLVFSRVNFATSGDITASLTEDASPAVIVASVTPTVAPVSEATRSVGSLTEPVSIERHYTPMLASLRQDESRLNNFGEAGQVPVRLALFDDGAFEDRVLLPTRTSPANTNRRMRHYTELTAFQFQR
ncbi:MAG: hypothetical protein Q8M02_10885 [Candidatus Didemnitutus sp.]|nr:hypothetical protein [Candidatus Didemnitutus sp.]